MEKNLKNREAALLTVTLIGFLIGLGLLGAAFLNKGGLSFKNKENLLAQASSLPSITVISPNGGETYNLNTPIPVTWNTNFDSTSIVVYLYSPTLGNVFQSQSLQSMAGGSSGWTIPLNAAPSAGQYKVTICDNNKDNPSAPGKPLCDSSDNVFTITAQTIGTPTITGFSPTLGSAGTKLRVYGTNLTGLNKVTLTQRLCCKYYKGTSYSSEWSPVSNTEFEIPMPSLSAGDYLIDACTSAGCTSSSADGPVFTIVAPITQPTVDLKANNIDGPITISYGTSEILTWTSSGVSNCSGSRLGSGTWGGVLPTSGAQGTGNLTSATTFTISCQNSAGVVVTDSVTVNVSLVPPPPPPPPPTTLTCDATAKAILNAVGGCSQLDSSHYPNVYKACCTLVTKETLLAMLDKALQDGIIDDQEKADLLRALDSYLSASHL